MSDGHSDPDLLSLEDIPDTGTGMALPDLGRLVRGVQGLKRLAIRHHSERKWLRTTAMTILGTVVVGAVGMIGTVIGAALYVGARLERYETNGRRIDRLERAMLGVDEVTAATEGD